METIERLSKSLPADQLSRDVRRARRARARPCPRTGTRPYPETGGYNTQLAPYDLEDPAKILVPRQTPLRNAVPRDNSGKGSARAVPQDPRLDELERGRRRRPVAVPRRRSSPPAQGIALPQFGGQSTTTGGVQGTTGVPLRRGQKINYAADSKTVNYTEMSLSDSVSWKAQYIGQGFEDIRQLSHTATLWAHMLGEEKALLYSRGPSANGYTGPIAAPTGLTVPRPAPAARSRPPPTRCSSPRSAAGASRRRRTSSPPRAITGTGTLTITAWPTLPSGADGWNVYVFTAATGNFFFQTFVPAGSPRAIDSGTGADLLQQLVWARWRRTPPTARRERQRLRRVPDGPAEPGACPATWPPTRRTAPRRTRSTRSPGSARPAPRRRATRRGRRCSRPCTGRASSRATTRSPGTATAYGQKLLADPDVVYVDGVIRSALGSYVEHGGGSGLSSGNPGGYRIQLSPGRVSAA